MVSSALLHSYPARVVLNRLIQSHPQHANKINNALAANYPAEVILRKLSGNRSQEEPEENYLTEHEKVQKRDTKQKRKAALQALGVLGTAGAVAAGAIGYATRNQPGGAVRPSQILPAPRGQGPQRGGALPAPQQQQLGYQPRPQQQPPQAPQSPIQPQGGPQQLPMAPQVPQPNVQPPAPRNIDKNVTLVRNIRADTQIENILKSAPDVATAAAIIRKVMPRVKVDLLDRTEGGLEQIISDYSQHLQDNPPAVREQFQPKVPRQQMPPVEQMQQPEMQQQQQPMEEQQAAQIKSENQPPEEDINEIELFHTSPNIIKDINDYGRFGSSLFFSRRPYYMSEQSKHLYKIKENEDKILDVSELRNLSENDSLKIKPFIEEIMGLLGVDEEKAIDLLSEDTDVHSMFNRLSNYMENRYDDDDDEDRKEERKRLYDELSSRDLGELSWDIQHLSFQAAQALGYEGAKLTDEQGTSYLINMKGREKELRLMKDEDEEADILPEVKEVANTIVMTPEGPAEIKHDGEAGKIVKTEKGQKSFAHDDIEKVPEDVIQAVSNILQIPEEDRSSNIALFMYNPQDSEMYFQFHDGSAYKYYGIDPEKVFRLANKMSIPITSGQNIFGAWSPDDKKSLGATFYQEVLKDPKYKKSKKGEPPNPNYVKLETLYDYWEKLRKKKYVKKSKEKDVG